MGHYDRQEDERHREHEERRKALIRDARLKHLDAIQVMRAVFGDNADKVEAFLRDTAANPQGNGR